ncbi:GFA family protein [Histidinibacterium aquaticum]|uniref:GFA family protein n=1 Tax=Histidinibacterium aquaticum TaxID=2613962 RepID=A0A5J5GET6_9RHOB|nr:GFA family protein [Histidinibacterium aquaticum]KAA9006685.1 GFA family protein [Histidinibacterium aquaticum]
MARTGKCLCGAVRFSARETGGFGVCHCSQCQRWAGSALFGVTVPEASLRIEGEENVGTFRSSEWASRSFCTTCGSALWYRYDKGRDGVGDYEIPVGLFDDGNGFELKREIFADLKPDSWSLEGEHDRLTEAQTRALYG